MTTRSRRPLPLRVLVLCTGNSARSIMAEALFQHLGQGRIEAFSAGSRPVGRVNPLALEQIKALGLPETRWRSKSWDEFARPDAAPLDLVVTVCDNAAGESCPLWHGTPIRLHWGFPDPAAVSGSELEKRESFARVYAAIRDCVAEVVRLPLEDLDHTALDTALRRIQPLAIL